MAADSLLFALEWEQAPVVRKEMLEALGKCVNADQISDFLNYEPTDSLSRAGFSWGLFRAGVREIVTPKMVTLASSFLGSNESYATRLGAAHFLGRARELDITAYQNTILNFALTDPSPNVRMALASSMRNADEEFALQAFDTLALDYLVKPVEKMRLKLTVDKLKRLESNTLKPQIDALLDLVKRQNEIKTLHSIPYKIGDRIILVKSEKISHFVASEKYVEFFTVDSKKHITDLSLKRLEECLPRNFFRVHRSTIVNTAYVKEFRKYFRGKYILILDDLKNTRIETGRTYSEKIHQLTHFE